MEDILYTKVIRYDRQNYKVLVSGTKIDEGHKMTKCPICRQRKVLSYISLRDIKCWTEIPNNAKNYIEEMSRFYIGGFTLSDLCPDCR